MHWLLLLMILADASAQPAVVISSVNPSQGSLVGGTRMHIKGTGFSNNMGGLCWLASLALLRSRAIDAVLRCCRFANGYDRRHISMRRDSSP